MLQTNKQTAALNVLPTQTDVRRLLNEEKRNLNRKRVSKRNLTYSLELVKALWLVMN